MHVYNKKGLIWAIVWTSLGVFNFVLHILSPKDLLPAQLKTILFSIALILIGLNGFFRAFSKEATRKDTIEEQDERNNLVRLKTKALTLKILYGCLALTAVVGLIVYKFTENTAWASTFTVAIILLGFISLVEMLVSFYCEKHM